MTVTAGVGPMLRDWRRHRRLSQLDLAIEAEVSARHLSFVETGRSRPSRELLLHLAGHEPFPAVVVDRRWDLVSANRPAMLILTDGVAPELLEPPVNTLRVSLHPGGLAPRIGNFAEYSAHLLHRIDRSAVITADPDLTALADELRGYPGVTERSAPLDAWS